MASFGCLPGGRALRTDFAASSPDKFTLTLESPGAVAELAVFVLPGVTLPPECCVLVFAGTPATGFTTIGALAAARPSSIVRTGWATNADVAALPAIQIGLSIEPIANAAPVLGTLARADIDRLSFAQLVAGDLYNYIQSFSHAAPHGGEQLVLPPNVIDSWFLRFSRKFQADPNFLATAAATQRR